MLWRLGRDRKRHTKLGPPLVAAADSDTSIYKIARLKSNLVPLQMKINNDAITSGSDYDLGLYKTNGDVLDKDCFVFYNQRAGEKIDFPAPLQDQRMDDKEEFIYSPGGGGH